MIKFSFIIPAYNAELYILECINSIIKDPRTDIEIILINDGSTDKTIEVAQSINDSRIIVLNQENAGVSVARNTGINASKGEYLIFLDADDVYNIEHLDKMAKPFEKDKNIVLTYASYIRITSDGKPMPQSPYAKFFNKPSGSVLKKFLARNYIATTGICCIKADIITKSGLFNPTLRTVQDWEYWCRLACEGKFFFISDVIIMKYRKHPSSATSTKGDNPDLFFMPAVNAVYSNERILNIVPKEELDKLKRSRLSHNYMMTSYKFIAKKKQIEGLKFLLRAIIKYPPRTIEFVARYLCALAGR